MVDIAIKANAFDYSGGAVILSTLVSSNEPEVKATLDPYFTDKIEFC